MSQIAAIPMKVVGPVKIVGAMVDDEVKVPLATYESPLWNAVKRGARVSREAGGIRAVVVDECMTRSVLLEAPDAEIAAKVVHDLRNQHAEMEDVVAQSSNFAELKDINFQIVGNLIYLRLSFFTADAAGHNMATKAADCLMGWALKQYPQLKYVSISANYCTDKKVSAVNGILGRGKYVVAEITIPREICQKTLKTTPEKIVELNIKKNLLGTMLAGGLRSANAHFANMLLGFYLATGQDAANIVEGSQGFVHTEVRENNLYFSVTLPNIIVGTVGNGKDLKFVKDNLAMMGCLQQRNPGENSSRLAIIAAATVLCGELSLLAALTNQGELMKSHELLERRIKRGI
jgi:hydroxymethylglutaryl-CoA reductase (NADPH)